MVSFVRAAILVLAAVATATSAAPLPAIVGRDQAVEWAVNATSREPAEQTLMAAGAKFISVHFSEFRLAEGDVVSLTDANGKLVWEYTGLGRGDLGDKGGFYSSQVFSSAVTVQYKPSATAAPTTSANYGFKIDKIVRSSSSAKISAVCSADDSLTPKCYIGDASVPQAYQKAQAVARLTIEGGKYCTGWLLGTEGHLVTNAHCISSQATASNTDYEFEAESPTCEDQCKVVGGCKAVIAATTATLLAFDTKLDYAIVKLNPIVDISKYGGLKLRVAGGVQDEQIYVPQHPSGNAKRIAVFVDDGSVARAVIGTNDRCGTYRVKYFADTKEGSSGSPILAASDNAVIGLHSCGFAEGDCFNSGIDSRALIYALKEKNALPASALDDPNAELAMGPWIPGYSTGPTPAPTPATTLDYCKSWSKNTCATFSGGKCKWENNACVKI